MSYCSENLSNKYWVYYQNVIDFYQKHSRMPSIREIGELIGIPSKGAVFNIVEKLVLQGLLNKDDTGRLIPGKAFFGIPFLELVEEASLFQAEQPSLHCLNLQQYLIGQKKGCYVLHVKGDSLIDAGIFSGDLVVVEKTSNAREGDLVLCDINGDWTLKRLCKDGKNFFLKAENSNDPAVYPQDDLKIAAVVRGVIRKY